MEELKKKLAFSAARFEAIARTATDAIVISDENSVIIFANKRTCEIFGFEESEILGLNLRELMPEKYRAGHNAGMQRFISSGIPKLIGKTIEIEGLRKNGSVFPLELSLSSWKEEKHYFFSGIIRDISKRKEISEEREEAAKQLQEKQKELKAANEELQSSQEELQAANEELRSSQEELLTINEELLKKEELLKEWNQQLEKKVTERTREQQRAKAEAEHQRARLENFLTEAPALICVHKGDDFIFEFVNPPYQKIFPGRSLLGKPLLEALPELAGTPIWDIVLNVYRTGESYEGREVLIPLARYDGGPLENNYYNFIYQPRFNPEGKTDGIMVFAYDVTDQVKARKVMEESAGRFRFMADSMPQKVWTAKADGNVDYYNQKWLEYTGLTFEELKDWGWKNIIHHNDLKENEELWKHSIKTGEDFQLEHRLRRNDGQYRWHLSRGIAYKNEKGNIKMWVGTTTDIHDNRLAHQQLLQTQENLRKTNEALTRTNTDLDSFVYTASHDLKSPIANLEGLIGMAKKNFAGKISEKDNLLLNMMETSILRLRKTIVDLSEITRAQKGFDEEPEQVSFKNILEEIKADLVNTLRVPEEVITADFQVSEVLFSQKNLRSILYNLLSNAIKYQSHERNLSIEIKTYHENEYVVLSVKDNGIGLSRQQIPKLFTMFKRLHSHVEGTGIGLYIVKRIVENNGGKIELESRLDSGSTFKVYLPDIISSSGLAKQ